MPSRCLRRIALGALIAVASPTWADFPSLDTPHSSFHPSRAGALPQEGGTPGITINDKNYQLAAHLLPAEVLRLVQAGDFTIAVQETTDLPPRDAYIRATMERSLGVSLDGGYTIHQYTGGRPFPVLDPADPQAGEKAAWNFRYRDVPDTLEMRITMDGVTNTGVVDRASIGRIRTRNGMDRVGAEENDQQWTGQGVRTKASFEAFAVLRRSETTVGRFRLLPTKPPHAEELREHADTDEWWPLRRPPRRTAAVLL